jgi:hypothetical protein
MALRREFQLALHTTVFPAWDLNSGALPQDPAARIAEGRQRRIMSYPLVIRLMIAMTLMPDASYREALARLAGLLADIPFILEWHVPA